MITQHYLTDFLVITSLITCAVRDEIFWIMLISYLTIYRDYYGYWLNVATCMYLLLTVIRRATQISVSCLKLPNKIVILGNSGGVGKTTLANLISKKYGHSIISVDKCKYKPGWVRYNIDEFEQNIQDGIDQNPDQWIIEGLLGDRKAPRQIDIINKFCMLADLVIVLRTPRIISVYRVITRSLKRRLKLVEQGASKESWSNIKAVIKNTWNNYNFHNYNLQYLRAKKIVEVNWPETTIK